MTRAFTVEVDRAEIDHVTELLVTAVLREQKLSIRAQTRALEQDFEAATRQHVKGRLWRGWKSLTYPKGSQLAYEPTGEVFVNGGKRSQGAMIYWTQAGINRSANGFYLAVPTDYAGVNNRTRSMTPGEWERRNGVHLRFVYRGGGEPSLLVAEQVVFGANGKGTRVLTKRRRQNARYVSADGSPAKVEDVPIFTLIPFQRFANKFSLAPLMARRQQLLADDFAKRLARLTTRAIRASRS